MFKYELLWSKVKKVEIERETDSFVFFAAGYRSKKDTDWSSYHDTELEAYERSFKNVMEERSENERIIERLEDENSTLLGVAQDINETITKLAGIEGRGE